MNLANKITLARACLLPFIWIFWLLDIIYVLLFLLLANIVGDVLDGYVARTLKQETTFGAQFDGFVDAVYYISIFSWSFMLLPEFKKELLVTIAFACFPQLIALLKFKKIILFHLWSSKLMGGIFFIFFFTIILIPTISKWILLVLFITVVINTLERSIIFLLQEDIPSNLQTIFHLFKNIKERQKGG